MPSFHQFADQSHLLVPGYMLVFTRISAMMLTLPIFSYPMISGRMRIMFTLILTVIIGSIINLEMATPITNVWMLAGLMAKEMVIGMIIGFGSRLIFEGFSIEESLNRMIEWLSSNYDLSVNAIILNYVITSNGLTVYG